MGARLNARVGAGAKAGAEAVAGSGTGANDRPSAGAGSRKRDQMLNLYLKFSSLNVNEALICDDEKNLPNIRYPLSQHQSKNP